MPSTQVGEQEHAELLGTTDKQYQESPECRSPNEVVSRPNESAKPRCSGRDGLFGLEDIGMFPLSALARRNTPLHVCNKVRTTPRHHGVRLRPAARTVNASEVVSGLGDRS
jgi:hypothetical protein